MAEVKFTTLIVCAGLLVSAGALAIHRRRSGPQADSSSGIGGGPSIVRTCLLLVPLVSLVLLRQFSTHDDAIRVLVMPPLRILGGVGMIWVTGNLILRHSKKAAMTPLDCVDLCLCLAAMNYPLFSRE